MLCEGGGEQDPEEQVKKGEKRRLCSTPARDFDRGRTSGWHGAA